MGMFDFAKSLVQGQINKFSGNTDFLEAVCAGAALVTYADGKADDSEVMAALAAIETNPTLIKAFKQVQIQQTMDAMLKKAGAGMTGRVQLKRELSDIRNKPEMAELVLCTMIDVASADGSIADSELRVLNDAAQQFGLDAKRYLP